MHGETLKFTEYYLFLSIIVDPNELLWNII